MKFRKPDVTKTVNVLLYGPPKTGKSLGAGSAPGHVLYLNADSANAIRLVHEREGDRIQEVEVEGHDTLIEVEAALRDPKHPYDTVVVDPLSEVYRILLDEQSGNAVRPSLNQRGDVVVHLERFCRALRDAPVNAVFVAHELVVEGDDDQVRVLPFTGTSKPTLGLKVAAMVDVVGYTARIEAKTGGDVYMAQLVQGKGRIGGDRFDVLGAYRETNLGEWFALIGAKVAVSTTPAAAGKEREV